VEDFASVLDVARRTLTRRTGLDNASLLLAKRTVMSDCRFVDGACLQCYKITSRKNENEREQTREVRAAARWFWWVK
jgi:hypothetical protein